MRYPLFGTWLEETGRLQREAYGSDLTTLEGNEYGDHVMMNTTAIIAEIGEFLAEIPGWKTWVTERGRPDPASRGRAIGEMVDVLHFVANLLVGLRCSDVELRLVYQDKLDRNRARMETGTYDGKSDKCPGCSRAIDDVGTYNIREDVLERCNACHAVIRELSK